MARSTSGGNAPLPELLMVYSRAFVKAEQVGDAPTMDQVSQNAWAVLRQLVLLIRHAEDSNLVSSTAMPTATGVIAENLSLAEQQAMLNSHKVNRRHANCRAASLRECFNKMAHPTCSTYRVDGRGTHFLLLSGPDQRPTRGPWVIEFSVKRLAEHAAGVIASLPPV